MKRVLLTIFLAGLFVFTVCAQRNVTGTIINAEGKPLEGVSVLLKGTETGTVTDANGTFDILVPQEENTLVFKKAGYQVREVRINKNIVNITMNAEGVDFFDLSLEELLNIDIVTASKFSEPVSETPATVFVITSTTLQRRGYTSLSEVLNDIPGYDIAANYGNLNQLAYARGNRTGSYNERTMLMIDGVESNILYAQNMNISSDFPISAIERIEIIYGPASAIYGPNVFSGIINIITKLVSDLENKTGKAYVQNGVGDNNTQFGEITYIAKYEPLEIMASYRRYKSNMFDMTNRPGYFSQDLFGNSELWGPYTEYYPEFDNSVDDHAFLGKLKFKDLEFGYNHLLTKHGNGSEYPYDKTLPTTNWKFGRDILYLRYKSSVGEKFNLSFLGTYQYSGSLPENFWAQGWNATDDWNSERTVEMLTWKYMSKKWSLYEDFEYQALLNWKISGGLKLSSAEFQKSYEYAYSDRTVWIPGQQWTDPAILFPYPIGSGTTPGNTFIDVEWGGFVQSKLLLLNDRLSFVAGLRYDKNEIHGEIYSPRIGATYAFTDNLSVKTSYGEGFQTPAPRNLYGGWGGLTVNPDLKPDMIQAVDFGVLSTFSDFGFEVTLFNNRITNSIFQGENLPTKNIWGAECKINYILISDGQTVNNASIHLNYSYVNALYAEVRTNTATGRSSDKIGDIAPHKFNLIVNADLFKYLHINVRMNYVDKRPTILSNPIEEVDAFFVTNLNFQIINLFGDKLKIFFNVNNVFDEEYYHPGMDAANAGEDLSTPSDGWYSSRLPQPGRSFIGGIYLTL